MAVAMIGSPGSSERGFRERHVTVTVDNAPPADDPARSGGPCGLCTDADGDRGTESAVRRRGGAVLLGLIFTVILGWWWADLVVGVGLSAVTVTVAGRMGAWRGEDCC